MVKFLFFSVIYYLKILSFESDCVSTENTIDILNLYLNVTKSHVWS